MEKITNIFNNINVFLNSKLEELFEMPFSEFLRIGFDKFNNGLPDWVKALILLGVSIILLIGLFRVVKKIYKSFFILAIIGAIFFFVLK